MLLCSKSIVMHGVLPFAFRSLYFWEKLRALEGEADKASVRAGCK